MTHCEVCGSELVSKSGKCHCQGVISPGLPLFSPLLPIHSAEYVFLILMPNY